MSRRRVLAGALAFPAVAAGCVAKPLGNGSASSEGGSASDSPATNSDAKGDGTTGLLKIGTSGRIRGVCIGPGVADFRGDSAWTGLWQRWDWNGRIKNELDDALALGANCVRLFGNTHVITSGVITKDQYLQQWSQFLDYTKNIGLWVYPCGGDLSHWGGYTTLGAAREIYRSWAELLARYDHVVGVDITNEAPAQSRNVGGIAYGQPESWLYTVRLLGELVRASSGKPITHSRGLTSPSPASWQFGSPETDALSDFLDVHAYRATSPKDADVLYASDWAAGKQLIIGEFGANMTIDSATRAADYEGIKSLIDNSPNCVGGLAWTIYDTGTDPASQYGLLDPNRAPRADIATSFGTFPTTR